MIVLANKIGNANGRIELMPVILQEKAEKSEEEKKETGLWMFYDLHCRKNPTAKKYDTAWFSVLVKENDKEPGLNEVKKLICSAFDTLSKKDQDSFWKKIIFKITIPGREFFIKTYVLINEKWQFKLGESPAQGEFIFRDFQKIPFSAFLQSNFCMDFWNQDDCSRLRSLDPKKFIINSVVLIKHVHVGKLVK